jgi:hypothetical protein
MRKSESSIESEGDLVSVLAFHGVISCFMMVSSLIWRRLLNCELEFEHSHFFADGIGDENTE